MPLQCNLKDTYIYLYGMRQLVDSHIVKDLNGWNIELVDVRICTLSMMSARTFYEQFALTSVLD